MKDSENAPRSEVAKRLTPPLRPKDAATLIIVDRSHAAPRILMGRRRADLAFLPNMFVFPGGRADRADRTIQAQSELDDRTVCLLLENMKGTPSPQRARGLALCAIREAFEETGVVVGRPAAQVTMTSPDPPATLASLDTPGPSSSSALTGPTDTLAAPGPDGPATGTWRQFRASGFIPALGGLRLLARAITPPGRPRRFDTRFFCVDAASTIATSRPGDGELESIDWFSIDEIRALPVPSITRAIIEDLADRLDASSQCPVGDARPGTRGAPVPFYYLAGGTFQRTLLGRGTDASAHPLTGSEP